MNLFAAHFLPSQTVFNHLADATCLFIKFDGIFESSQLKNLWPHYVAAVKVAEQNLSKFNEGGKISGDDVGCLKNIYDGIDYLLSGNLFQVCSNCMSTHG